ncbi:Oxoglutarate/iron-dependent dioxygenase [Penicillium hispanicum]|uniref:Oxoglutarate/iron-dependent dioxygenase n=1 Tax=Penicillium hispanicum TaxID=1080232 RepID=UPI0025415A59|nr:Oxoglutarate/iron-dependent dioxygenase [Penicillium hispanicum]KAJ5594700.1 Oxoglutarate/iron-dependent dioxygenase [Penicillium hispanicum]
MAKRTLDAFFQPSANAANKRPKHDLPSPDGQPANPPSSHSTYPFPITSLPSHIEVHLSHSTPARSPRPITNQPDLDLLSFQPYIARTTATELFRFLRRELPFYRVQYQIKRAGVETQITTPRFTTVFGVDDTATFVASPSPRPTQASSPSSQPDQNLVLVNATTKAPIPASKYAYAPRPIPACLDHLRRRVEAATGARYNFCLVNYYAGGEDSIAFHADDERFLGAQPVIASLSLGGEREFLMKHKPATATGAGVGTGAATIKSSLPPPQLKMPLASGDMVVMRGCTQANWEHSIPKRRGRAGDAVRGRINVTFRRAVVPGGTNNYYHYNVGRGGVYRWDEGRQRMVLKGDVV